MTFPVNSTSTITAAIKRLEPVLSRTKVDPLIASGTVFVCKKITGSTSWSQHSWGNAMDIFPFPQSVHLQANLRAIADAVVFQATHKTRANRFTKLAVAEVIDHDGRRIWTPSEGWHPYGGTTGPHIHVSGKPLKTGTPPCA